MNEIHSSCIIEGNVELGENNKILPYTIIMGPTKIGNNNIIGPHVTIGTPGQDTRNPRYDYSNCFIEIGDNNIIREFTAIQKPCYRNVTKIGNDVFLMQSVHIPHDAILHDKVVVTPMCVVGGIVTVLEGANIGMGATIHQYSIIGHYSIAATGAAVVKNIKPFSRYIPGRSISVNEYAIQKYGWESYKDEISKYVMEGIKPRREKLLKIVEEYENLHRISNREQY